MNYFEFIILIIILITRIILEIDYYFKKIDFGNYFDSKIHLKQFDFIVDFEKGKKMGCLFLGNY